MRAVKHDSRTNCGRFEAAQLQRQNSDEADGGGVANGC
jgi:hypothetical protein